MTDSVQLKPLSNLGVEVDSDTVIEWYRLGYMTRQIDDKASVDVIYE